MVKKRECLGTNKLRDILCAGIILLGLFFYYIVLLDSPYFADDIYNSCIRGNINEMNQNIWEYMFRNAVGWAKMGRVFPLALGQYLVFYIFRDVVAYKLFLILYTLLDICLFRVILRKTVHNDYVVNMGVILLGIMMPVYTYDGVNPMNTFGGLVHGTLMFGLLAIIFTLMSYEKHERRWLWLGAVCAACSMLSYEPGWIFPVILFLLGIFYSRSIKEILASQIPNIILCGGVAVATFAAKLLSTSLIYDGVVINFDISKIIETFWIQFSGAIPFVSWIKAARPAYLFQDVIECYKNIDAITVMAIVVLICAIVLCSIKTTREYSISNRNCILVCMVGILLWVFPALLIAISAKYQENLTQYHLPYLPFFMEVFGMCLLIAGFAGLIYKNTNPFRVIVGGVLAVVMVIIIPVYTYSMRLSNEASRLLYKDMRQALVEATYAGIFDGTEEDATIVLDNRYIPTVSCNVFSMIDSELKTDYYVYQESRWVKRYNTEPDNAAATLMSTDDNTYLVKCYVTEQQQIVFVGKVSAVNFNGNTPAVQDILVDEVRLYVKLLDENAVTTYPLSYYDSDMQPQAGGINLEDYFTDENVVVTNKGVAYLFELDNVIYNYMNTIF